MIEYNCGTLFYDAWCGRSFYSDLNKIKHQVNLLNQMMIEEENQSFKNGAVTLNDFYKFIGLEETKAGQNLVWRIWKEGIIELKIEKKIINSQRHLVIDFVTPPAYLPTWIVEDILKRRKEHA